MLDILKKSFSAVMIVLVLTVPEIVRADNTMRDISTEQTANETVAEQTISTSYNGMTQSPIAESVKLFEGEQKLVEGEKVSFSFHIDNPGAFQIEVQYLSNIRRDAKISVEIDQAIPFTEAENITLPTHFKDDNAPRIDGNGNEFAPEQIVADLPVRWVLCDNSGKYEEPYCFFCTAGKHTFDLTVKQGDILIQGIWLIPPETPSAYESPDIREKNENLIVIEGEKAILKSGADLIPLSEDNSADVNPSSATAAKINYIGGSNWAGQGDTLYWKLTIETGGYYRLGFLYRQKDVLGGISYRHLKIDGKTPFAESQKIKFKYGTGWQFLDYRGENGDYWLYLEKGEHTLSLTVTAGELTDIYRRLKETATDLGNLYVEITMVVGETVDVSRSYELFNQIPDFKVRLQTASDRLETIASDLEALQEKKGGSNVSIIRNAVETIQKMVQHPYSAHRYKSAYYSAYTNLSALLGTITNMPLDIDRIFVIGSGADFEDPRASFLQRFSFGISRFLNSFAGEYGKTVKQEEGLTIWVNWGRDQTQVLDSLIQSDFVRHEKIQVRVKLVNATLIQALLSGSGPDVMLQMSRTEPVNLAMRGALVDLTTFSDYKEITTRFTKGAAMPFAYRNGVYALPDTLSFYMMFARTDILKELGLELPNTWQDFVYAMTILQHSNLQVSLPYTQITDSTTVNVGVGGLTLYPTMLLQNGLSLYNNEMTASTMTQELQIRVFTEWAELYTKYKAPVTMNFYNRFRIGSAPLGVAPYTLYTELKAAAPEIDGRWIATLIPGTLREDGSVDHTSAGSGAGCAITKLSKHPEDAWKFLKWWTSADTQLKYSESLESLLGPLGRVASANIEALNRMIWDVQMLDNLNRQLDNVVQIPEVPGGYYTARGIDQVFWNVVEQNENPTDMMLKWGVVVDSEIERKRQEFAEP